MRGASQLETPDQAEQRASGPCSTEQVRPGRLPPPSRAALRLPAQCQAGKPAAGASPYDPTPGTLRFAWRPSSRVYPLTQALGAATPLNFLKCP